MTHFEQTVGLPGCENPLNRREHMATCVTVRNGTWVSLPYVGQGILRQSRMHEDILHFIPADKTVQISVGLQEDIVIAPAVRHWDHPVQRMLRQRRRDAFLS